MSLMNCEETAKLVSEGKDRDLPFHRRINVRFHLVMCKMCRRYRDQLEMLSRIAESAGQQEVPLSEPTLSPSARARIEQKLKDGS